MSCRRETYLNGTRSQERFFGDFSEFFFVLSSLARYALDLLTALYYFSSYHTHLASIFPVILGSHFSPPPPPPPLPSRPRLRLRLRLCLRLRLLLCLRLPTFALASCTPNRLGTRMLHAIRASESILGGNGLEIAPIHGLWIFYWVERY
jgi:hypothetical protein